jgi:predicted permease
MLFLTRLWNLFRRDRLERELQQELDTHLALLEEAERGDGRSAADAQQAARLRFGNPLTYRERTVDGILFRWVESCRQDVRDAIRQLVAAPLLTAVLVATLGLGIGLTAGIFSVVDAVLLRPLPFPESDRLVVVWETLRDLNHGSASAGHFNDWTTQNTVFDETAATVSASYNLSEVEQPERLNGTRVTPGYFRIAALPPAAGRYFTDTDMTGDTHLAVISHSLWHRRFSADPAVIGRQIRLNGESYTIVGVAPEAFALTDGRRSVVGGFTSPLWTPLVFSPANRANYGTHTYRVLARLKPGVSRKRAQQDLERVSRDIAVRQPQNTEGRGVHVESYRDSLLGNTTTVTTVTLAAVASVLLIGCVNISSLLLARATARRREMAIRAALGGGRGRIVRQLLTESLVLALAGGMLALGVARLTIQFLVKMGPADVPRLHQAAMNSDVLLFTFGITLGAAFLFGLAPALRMARSDLQASLREGGKDSRSIGGRDRLRSVLVVSELTLSVVLVVAAGLFIRSAWRVQQVPLGFAPDRALMARVSLPASRYQSTAATVEAYRQMVERVRAIPGVTNAGGSSDVPMNLAGVDVSIGVEGRTLSLGAMPNPQFHLVTDGYLEAIGMSITRGRALQATDMRPGAPLVIVLNEKAVRDIWPGENPIGKRVACCTMPDLIEWREVVGVVADAHTFGPASPVQMEMFVPYTQAPDAAWGWFQRSIAFVARTKGAPADSTRALRQAIGAVDTSLPLYAVQTFDEVVSSAVDGRRFNMFLMSLLAATGLALAAIGIYGIVAYSVAQRRSEIGLRLALGATGRSIVGLVLRQGAVLASAGIVAGVAVAAGVTRLLSAMLFEITPTDVPTYVAGALLFFAVALLASTLPAMSALRVDPVRTLGDS